MTLFAGALLDGGRPILGPGAVAEMTRDQLTPEQRAEAAGFVGGGGWGLCRSVVVDGPRAGAVEWNGGLGTSWLVDPGDFTLIVMTTRMFETALTSKVHEEIQDAAYRALH